MISLTKDSTIPKLKIYLLHLSTNNVVFKGAKKYELFPYSF